jgi:xanthine/CO dehydrogenase XdhC/CoxF family maturation factor
MPRVKVLLVSPDPATRQVMELAVRGLERRLGERPTFLRASDGVEGLGLGPRQFAVVQTHALVHDRDWLRALLPLPLAYVGLLGPQKRKEEILRQLGSANSEKLFAPVGLDLGADGPEQVAISIVAELLTIYSGRSPLHLRDKAGGIHGR